MACTSERAPWLGAWVLLGAAYAASIGAQGRVSTVPAEGIAERPLRHVALTGARAVIEPGRVIEDATIELRDGRIVAVGRKARPPEGAEVRDLRGKTVFAGFIEPASRIGVPESMRAGAIKPFAPGQTPLVQTQDQAGARHWNRRVRAEWSVAEALDYRGDEAKVLRELGFAAALSVPEAGIVRGQGALLQLRDSASDRDIVIGADAVQVFGFDLAGGFSGEYPGSLMGAIALIRQALLDARWQSEDSAQASAAEPNLALRELAKFATGGQRGLFALDDELDVARVATLVREFGLDALLLGTGHEYRVMDQLRAARLPLILPLVFPETPAVEDPDVALSLSLAELEHWEQAPANAARLAQAGVSFAFTTRGLKDSAKEFWPALRRAVHAGLDESAALKALTVAPAEMLGETSRLGRLVPGQFANLVVADAGLLRDEAAKIYEVWVEGERHELVRIDAPIATGTWRLTWNDGIGPDELTITGKPDALDVAAGEVRFKAKFEAGRLTALPPGSLFEAEDASVRLSAVVEGESIEGYRMDAQERRRRFTGVRSAPAGDTPDDAADTAQSPQSIPSLPSRYPAGEYGRSAPPLAPDAVVFRGATVWTNRTQGVLENADVLVRSGRIAAVGSRLDVPRGALEIDVRGLHLTPGIVDAHSHTAIARNVNEPSHAVTTEVRVADVLDPTDIDIYRQLAGGVTTANLLHGSANPMGGQNAVIKLRWGSDAKGLLFEGAAPGVKFALGENVKQSGWGDAFTSRYPQTRMGVEQIMREHFLAARDYDLRRKRGGARRDLRLEALAEVLAGERLIHIHSYRQDEILMFVRLAQEFRLPVATFQHVLEGYKVAPEIASIGAGASTFSDWWAFKMEVIDAIPHNSALMTRSGVLTSVNSDSNEMARRLTMEAAKTMRYGGLDAQEALKLVTLNPATQLGLQARVGSIAPGMDADLVVWSAPPLSNYARAEQTWIDGRRYFDRGEDRAERERIADERTRLIQRASEERAKTLSLVVKEGGKEADAAPKEPATPAIASDPDLQIQAARDAHWLIHHAAARGIYHSGADLSSCGVNDHAH